MVGTQKAERADRFGTYGRMEMKEIARTTRRPKSCRGKRTVIILTAAEAECVRMRQLEESVSWTSAERLRCLWYRFRLTVHEMNYATRRMVELQMRLP
jgi:hypothetical protein